MLQFKDFYLRKARNIKRDMSRKRGYQLGELYLYVVAVKITRVRGYQYNPNPTPNTYPHPTTYAGGGGLSLLLKYASSYITFQIIMFIVYT